MVPTVVSNDILVDAEKVDTAVDPANAEIEGIVKPAAPKLVMTGLPNWQNNLVLVLP